MYLEENMSLNFSLKMTDIFISYSNQVSKIKRSFIIILLLRVYRDVS